MPANLTPDYHEAEARYRQARTPREKVAALEEMLAKIPKHKGTEKLQADIKRRIARAREQDDKKSGGKRHSLTVSREGAAQVVLLGAPNVGKSQMVASLTHARPEVAPYPFTTRVPQPGMMAFENVQIQLVDMPALSSEHLEGWVSSVIRAADAGLLVANLADDDVLDQVEEVLSILEGMRIFPGAPGHPADLAQPSHFYLPTMLVGWQADQPGAADRAQVVREVYGGRFPVVELCRSDEEGLRAFPRRIFEFLDLMRVYTQAPGQKADRSRPFVLRRGSTVAQLAEHIHKDFALKLKFARIWGSATFDGQRVQRDYVLHDEDVVELHV